MADKSVIRSFISLEKYDDGHTVYVRHNDIMEICQMYERKTLKDGDVYVLNGCLIKFYDINRKPIHVKQNANEVSNMIFNADNSWYIREAME